MEKINGNQFKQPQLDQPKNNKKGVWIAIIISIVVTALITTAIFCFFILSKIYTQGIYQPTLQNVNSANLSIASTSSTTIELAQNLVATSTDISLINSDSPKNYSFVRYPISQSPIYSKINSQCLSADNTLGSVINDEDVKIVKNGTEVIIPSLKKLYADSNQLTDHLVLYEDKDCYRLYFYLLPAPDSGDYIYFNLRGESPIGGFSFPDVKSLENLYSFNIKDKSLKKINIISNSYIENYQLLTDGKRMVQWDRNGVYLINFETNSKINLFIAPQNQWLISSIVNEGMRGSNEYYNVKVEEGQEGYETSFGYKLIKVNVYDKTKTQDGEKILIDENGNVSVQSKNWNEETDIIKPRFLDKIDIEISN